MGIKMICSDLDGTILSYTQTEITPRMLQQIKRLSEKGIIFVPTSGRQIVSMQKLFAPVTEHCYYICSNGAVICDGSGTVIDSTVMDRDIAYAIADDFMNNYGGRSEVNIAGPRTCHLWSRDFGMVDRLRYIGNKFDLIQKPEDVQEDIVKVSVFLPDGSVNYIDRITEKWKQYNPVIAGTYWIDITLANKGTGVQRLCDILRVDTGEVAAFGDNYNDISMLDLVGQPYLMSTADKPLLQRYQMHTASVEDSLEEILNQ